MKILITGSRGLIGGEAVLHFDALGHTVIGADNNMRRVFFGDDADTKWNLSRIYHVTKNYFPTDADITSRGHVWSLFATHGPFDAVIHCAAQPSHDYASNNPELDYKVNVWGTKNLLDHTLEYSPNAVFIFTSTNKVYDDAVNAALLEEYETRYDCLSLGFDESTPVGASNIFGTHKLAADQLVQEYAKKGLKTVVVRGGCLTGPGHSSVALHGFLSYLLKCAITGKPYTIFGYQGKQVRDNIHSYDVCRIFEEIIKNPRPGEVYNIGGGRENSVSILEACALIKEMIGRPVNYTYSPNPRSGDHQWYITDMSKFRSHYPDWKITKSLRETLSDMIYVDFWGRYCDHEDTRNWPLGKDSVVWDVGGFRGSWTQSIVDKYDCYVHVFEPVNEFYEACVYRFRNNPKVQVHNYGIGATTELVTVQKQGQNSSTYRGADGQQPMPVDKVHGTPVAEQISLRNVSDVLMEFGGHADLVSFNCEGGEYRVLEKLIETGEIAKFDGVQVQFHNFWNSAPAWREAIRQYLTRTHQEKYNYPWTWEGWTLK